MQKELPPLPVPDRTMWQYGQKIDHFTADQMKAYALAAIGKRAEPCRHADYCNSEGLCVNGCEERSKS